MRPYGSHAIFIDVKKMLPHIDALEHLGQSLAVALYIKGCIRGVEIGSLMFGRPPPNGREVPHRWNLVRLAMPRRVYTQAHADYIVECFKSLRDDFDKLSGFEITWEPSSLRHFTAKLRPIH
jgi:tyrosine phenol-lyase